MNGWIDDVPKVANWQCSLHLDNAINESPCTDCHLYTVWQQQHHQRQNPVHSLIESPGHLTLWLDWIRLDSHCWNNKE